MDRQANWCVGERKQYIFRSVEPYCWYLAGLFTIAYMTMKMYKGWKISEFAI